MKIVRPLKHAQDLVIAYDLIDPTQLKSLQEYWTSSLYHNWPDMTDKVRSDLGYEPPENVIGLYDLVIDKYLDNVRARTKEIMNTEYGNFRVRRFQDFGSPGLRCASRSPAMKPHLDGPPEYDRPYHVHKIKSLGANFYLNDDFEGGEIYYPEIDFSFKPVPNAVVIHVGDSVETYRHGVRPVTSGWRLGFGMFAFEKDYKLEQLEKGFDSDI